MFILEKWRQRQTVPVPNSNHHILFQGKINVLVSTKTDKLLENEEDETQEIADGGDVQGAMRHIAVLHVQLRCRTEF